MDKYAIYLDPVQFRELRTRVCRFLRRHPGYRRQSRSHLTLSSRMRLTLLAFRHNLRQRLLAGWFGISQSTVSRILAWMRAVFRLVLGDFSGAGALSAMVANQMGIAGGRPVILLVDGTLVPISQRRGNRTDYSGKHRQAGKNLQIVSDVRGKLLYSAPALPGSYHDRHAVAASGIEAALGHPRLLVHADKGYTGTAFIIPTKASKHHPLTLAQRVENREINVIRCPVERSIAHVKVLSILRTGIRTRSPHRERVIEEIIAVALGLVFFRQQMDRS